MPVGIQYLPPMDKLDTLNPQQREAVTHLGTPLLVLAGAGSGKTRVITHKIAHLIRSVGIDPRAITAVTFTNKAAREMKQRVAGLLDARQTRGLTVCTFHSLGLQFLRREHQHLDYRSGFSVLDSQDCEGVLRELTHGASEDVDLALLRQRISHWKNALVSPEQALSQAGEAGEHAHARIFEAYQRQLHAYNAVDFDDLISHPARLLQTHEELRTRWQNRIRYLLIDEYQDTNASQYALMRLLAGIGDGLTAVGDDDQSVYAWRGARPENLVQLTRDYPTLKVIKLEQNYRSTERILQTANQLISRNPHVFEKRLWSDQGHGTPVRILPCKDPEHEAERIVGEIIKLQFRYRDDYGNYAILYRGNHQGRTFEKALRHHNIPYVVSGGTSFFERAEIKDILAYLRVITNPDDDPAFLRIVNTPRRQIGASTLARLGQYAGQRDTGLLAASSELGLEQHLGAAQRTRLSQFVDWLQELRRRAAGEHPEDLVRTLVRDLAYYDWLHETSTSRDAAKRRIENVEELLAWIGRLARDTEDERPELEPLVAKMALMDLIERKSEDDEGNGVHLMTLHAAKGLEFPHVWIAGVEEDLLPHHSHEQDGTLEEERRLAYVGITRAQQNLCLSYASTRSRYGEKLDCEPSRFLEELPAEHVQWEEGESSPGSPQAREAGKAHLSNLKAMLEE